MITVVVGFSKAKSRFAVLSKAIQLAENTPYSHAYIRFQEQMSCREIIFEASGMSVHFTTIEEFVAREYIVEEYYINIPDSEYLGLFDFMLDRLNIRYGVMELIYIGIKKLTGIKLVSGDGEKTDICSELVARVCQYVGMEVPGDLDYETPKKLNKFCALNMKRK